MHQKAESFHPDVILFSLEKPFPLRQVCPTLKTKFPGLAIVSFIQEASPLTLDLLYESGVDDYLIQPADFAQLHWKLKTWVRKVQGSHLLKAEQFEMGPLVLRPQELMVVSEGETFHVSAIQMKLLLTFLEHNGRLLTRDWLRHHVWNGEEISSRSIDAQISKLRHHLPALEITSVYGQGYVWKNRNSEKKSVG